MKRRLGIFGGTFDPIHLGHLVIAEQCLESAKLDEIRFIPAFQPPHKDAPSSFERRVEMLQLAIAGHSQFVIDLLERDRPGKSYTADTLGILQEQHPDADLFLIVGSDCLPDLAKWYQPQMILQRATLVVAERPGFQPWPPERIAESIGMPDSSSIRLVEVAVPLVDMSSTMIRDRVANGRSVRYLVPRSVEIYLREKRLYTPPSTEQRA